MLVYTGLYKGILVNIRQCLVNIMSVSEWISKANKKLSVVGLRMEVIGKKQNLYIRGMFPNKPYEPPGRKQRRIALKIKAITQDDVKLALDIALEVALDLNKGLFDWRKFEDFDEDKPKEKTIGYYITEIEHERKKTMTDYSWKYGYESLFKTLPQDAEPTEELLYCWILEQDPKNSTSRKKYITVARAIAEAAGLSTNKISKLSGEQTHKAINPRDLPEDHQIEIMWKHINANDPEWAWIYGMLATYGLRPHEIFRLDLSSFPDIRVLPETKTGERLVPPLYPDWVDKFFLDDTVRIPSNLKWNPEDPNWKLGRKIGNKFTKYHYGDPYNLRHCYARRCLEVGLSSDISCKLMGHSRDIHEQRYRAFIKGSLYVDLAKRIIDKSLNR